MVRESVGLSSAVHSAHGESLALWGRRIDGGGERLASIKREIREEQGAIAAVSGEMKGLGIKIAEPKRPVRPERQERVKGVGGREGGERDGDGDGDGDGDRDNDDNHEGKLENEIDIDVEISKGELDKILRNIKQGTYNGKSVPLPSPGSATKAQLALVSAAVAAKNSAIEEDYEEQVGLFEERGRKFEEARGDWEKREGERVERYDKVRYKVRLLNLKVAGLGELRRMTEEAMGRWEEERKLEERRGEAIREVDGRKETERAKQVMEGFRGPETVSFLIDQLGVSLEQRERAMGLPDAGITVLHRAQLEEKKGEILKRVRRTICRIRSQLVEEGRRRKLLYSEELLHARGELRRMREESKQSLERENALRAVDALSKLGEDAAVSESEAKGAEAREDRVGVDVEGADGEVYSEGKVWKTQRVARCQRERGEVQRCLGAAMEARKLAREREVRGRNGGLEGNSLEVPPHADMWLPVMER